MRSGIGKGLSLMLLGACAVAALGSNAAAGSEPGPIAGSLVHLQPQGGATAAAGTTIYRLDGTPTPNHVTAFGDSTGRLVLTSPEGIIEPDGAEPECVQDSFTQVSCMPGYIGAIAGDLGAGSDSFEAQASLPTLIGISRASDELPMDGGAGNDRIVGGLGGDLVNGGSGNDSLLGFGGGDQVRGEAGSDSIRGGGASDYLLGGGGPDKLSGGAARDVCNGGGGVDTAKSCNVARKVP